MRIRWYNPALSEFEWRTAPKSDEEAVALLNGLPQSQPCVEVYREWRKLGAGIVPSLIRAGEAARKSSSQRDEGR